MVRPGLVVAVTGYPRVIRMQAHWMAILSTGRAYDGKAIKARAGAGAGDPRIKAGAGVGVGMKVSIVYS